LNSATTDDPREARLAERRSAGNSETVSEFNNLLVLNCLRDNEPIPGVGIAQKLGMEQATVSRILRRLRASGFVRSGESGESRHRYGRRPTLLHLDRSARYSLGIDVCSNSCAGIVTDIGGQILHRSSRSTERGTADAVVGLVGDLLGRLPPDQVKKVAGVGIGAMDADFHAGTMRTPSGWVPIAQTVQAQFGIETSVDENSKAFAMAEKHFGFGRKASSFLCKWYRYGVGHALVIEGKPYRGARSSFGEMRDYLVPDLKDNFPDDPLRAAQVRPQAVVEIAKRMGDEAGPYLREAMARESVEELIQVVAEGIRHGDPATTKAVDRVAWAMSVGFSLILDFVDPELVIVGGPVTQWGDCMLGPLRKYVRQLTENPVGRSAPPRIEFTALGDDVIALGGAALVLDRLFAGAAGI
jgi:predicted NBD/HSP70 family sugar kinase